MRGEAGRAETNLAARFLWRANVLDVAASKRPPAPDDPRALRVTELFAEALEGSGCVVDRMSCHTANQGWIWFSEPRGLVYKATHAVVDLYVKDFGSNLSLETVTRSLDGRLPAGFAVAQDTVPNTVLRAQMPKPLNPVTALTPEGAVRDRETLDAAVAACREALRWLDGGGRWS